MNGEDRIIELLAEMVAKQDHTSVQQAEMLIELRSLNQRVESLEHQQADTNLALGELRLSVMKLGDELRAIANHETRIDALEKEVFKK